MNKITVDQVANWYLSKAPMSPKKLQEILYYAYAWFLTLANESYDTIENRLFENRFEAWVHGPVCPEIYHKYKEFGYNDIPQVTSDAPVFSADVVDVLQQVWDVYGGYTAGQLESISHQESPWINARENCSAYEICDTEITDEDIYKCYAARIS